jgi:hypothetical protein
MVGAKVSALAVLLVSLTTQISALTDWSLPSGGPIADSGHIGLINHDKDRRLEAWEDQALPVPAQIHLLGQHRHSRDGEMGRTKPVAGLRRKDAHHRGEDAAGSSSSNSNNRRKAVGGMTSDEDGLITPLFQGYGTHFSYVYVGTPPQRQSLIVDTGSHYTAFPCAGCAQCGSHTDAYWDMRNSSTARVSKCGKDPCSFGQSYSEGSSWKAIKVYDKFWVGGLAAESVVHGPDFSIDFMFGCQTSETGLFRTQLADGIMGMAMAKDTLPYVSCYTIVLPSFLPSFLPSLVVMVSLPLSI